MTTHELAKKLLAGPDVIATVRGYEGGVDEVTSVHEPQLIHLNKHEEWYYGKHEYHDDYCYECSDSNPTIQAIHIG